MIVIVFNITITILALWLIIFLNHSYLQPAIRNRDRFKLYKLRDELSMLAMSGELNEHSEEYITLLHLINSSIFAIGAFKVTDFLRYVFQLHKDKEMHARIERIIKNLKRTDNQKYCQIAGEYFSIMHRIIRRDTFVLRVVFFPIMILLAAIISLLRISAKPKSAVIYRKAAVEQIDNVYCAYSQRFWRKCTA